jgi:16S rRNA (cytidine1402-2'-O)-methyltransferase
VSQVAKAGHRVLPVPGPSSSVAAFSVAGDTTAAGFRFGGFFPGKGSERERAVHAACSDPAAQIWFEAPHRIASLTSMMAAAAPERLVTICRELTKQFESVATLPARQLPAWLAADEHRTRGEFVVVLHARPPAAAEDALPAAALSALELLLSELPLKQAVGLAARLTGVPRNALYQAALARRGDTPA